ncbi:MAG: methylated-DNA--[protein]-cysteine S-methyltransferase [Gaiellaceae bacterium]
MARVRVLYEADGFGVGELLLEDDVLLWHELPRPREAGSGTGLILSPTLLPSGEHPLATRLAAYFSGAPEDFADVTLDLSWCTPFQLAVVTSLRGVGRGETVTYGELAALAGHPGASRAAGSFCAHNRFGIIVPCHRVVAADGLGGYGSLGADYKRRLLALEGTTT